MWWVVMLAQFLCNWVKQLSNVGFVEVHISNISAQITLVLLLAHTRRRKIETKKFFKDNLQLCRTNLGN